MGARIGLHYAVRFPDRVTRLVLEAGSPGLESADERAARVRSDHALAERIRHLGMETFVDEWERLPLFESQASLSSAARAAQRARRLSNEPEGLASALEGLGTGALPSLWHSLGVVTVPTLVIVGALDRKFVEIGRRMVNAMPSATLVTVEGAGHAVHLERPEVWLEAVVGFLAG